MTGATGHMGFEGLRLLAEHKEFKLKLLIYPDKASTKKIQPYTTYDNIEIIEGDLRCFEDVKRCVDGADIVLHIGAIIPPAADHFPELAESINHGGTLNIIEAIKTQDNPEKTKLVYIGTVASMGDRMPPLHMVRTGDPIRVSKFDAYGASKVKAERAVISSGLPYWVSLRQTGMLHHDLLRSFDPIIFHQPLNNHLEWSNAQDSGRILHAICTKELPEPFWNTIYNISGGKGYQDTYYHFMDRSFKTMGIADFRKVVNPKQFATRNFHGCWYRDADSLNDWLDFRKISYHQYFKEIQSSLPFYFKLNSIVPVSILKNWIMKPLSRRKEGTLNWVEHNRGEKIKAFWGDQESWEAISENWDDFELVIDPPSVEVLHGYEAVDDASISLEDCKRAAVFRGGRCLSDSMVTGDLHTPLSWICAFGHSFKASPALILKGGHWCPQCDTATDNYREQAKRSPFFKQVFTYS